MMFKTAIAATLLASISFVQAQDITQAILQGLKGLDQCALTCLGQLPDVKAVGGVDKANATTVISICKNFAADLPGFTDCAKAGCNADTFATVNTYTSQLPAICPAIIQAASAVTPTTVAASSTSTASASSIPSGKISSGHREEISVLGAVAIAAIGAMF
jgi:hypothetical protein